MLDGKILGYRGFSNEDLEMATGFKYEEEPPIAPIWVSIHKIPVEFFKVNSILSMATAIGKPLKVDQPTIHLTRPSVARVCVEIDIRKDLPKSILIGRKGKEHEVFFEYENIPLYCKHYRIIGHNEGNCWKLSGSNATANKVPQPGKEMIPPLKTLVDNKKKGKSVWKPGKKDVNIVEKENVITAKTSTSGLSSLEKLKIPTVIDDRSPLIQFTTRTSKRLSKGQITQIINIDPIEMIPLDDDGTIETYNPEKGENEDLIQKDIQPSNVPTSEREKEGILADISENDIDKIEEVYSKVPAATKRILPQSFLTEIDLERFWQDQTSELLTTVSEGEIDPQLEKRRRGRPKGSKKVVSIPTSDPEGHTGIQTRRKARLAAVYAQSNQRERLNLWRAMKEIHENSFGLPWMVGGDFNTIRSLEEYSGQSQPNSYSMEDFNQCINDSQLMELQTLGSDFNWGGSRSTGWVRKKLDRILFSQNWLSLFPIVSVQHLNKACSDHSPLLHQFSLANVSKPRIFRFQRMWFRRPEFMDLVRKLATTSERIWNACFLDET